MNEQIEQYLKQHFCRDYFNSYGETVDDEHYFMYREEVEGLIELVVRECSRVSERTGALNEADIEGEMIADAIKEHFGL